MKPEDIFDKCLFRTNINMLPPLTSDTIPSEETIELPEIDNLKSDDDSTDSKSLLDINNSLNKPEELQPHDEDVIIEDVNDETVNERVVNDEIINDEQEILLTNEDPGEKTLEQEENTLEKVLDSNNSAYSDGFRIWDPKTTDKQFQKYVTANVKRDIGSKILAQRYKTLNLQLNPNNLKH